MLKQSLQHKLLQKLSPQQIQLIKLLEVPTMQLEQRIKKEIEENPALEEGRDEDLDNQEDDTGEDESKDDEFSLEDYIEEEDTPAYKLQANNYSKDDKKTEIPFSNGASFHEYMATQLGLRNLSEQDKMLAGYIIGNIDEDGYLRRDLEAIVDDLAFSQNISTTETALHRILTIIQDFDPPGVAARDLRECLMLQIDKKLEKSPESIPLTLTRRILFDFFSEFSKKHYDKIIGRLNISEEELKLAIAEVMKLNPKPGNTYGSAMTKTVQHITPDFLLEEIDGELVLSLNARNVPDLKLNRTYSEMLQTYAATKKKSKKDKEALTFVKQKIDSARWFIEAIRQRQNTLLHTMQAIIDYQIEYFKTGDETRLRPMILKDIAEITNLDISTISRVANSKYIQTNFGIYQLKFFFSEGMQTDAGEEVSTREIKRILQDCIGNESKKRPLTDEKLAQILQDKGYQIARRTVAKYREQMGILVARLRKEL